MVFQGFATGMAETAEVGVQRVLALNETFVQRLQYPVFGLGGGRPVDQRAVFQRLQLIGQAGGIDGGAQRALTQNRSGCAVEAIEKQTAGR
ncbi:hypothetical protein D3C72_1922570 [compost metagenome]